MVKRFLLLSGLAYGLLILGLATLQGGLIALALPLAIYLGAVLLSGPEELRLGVTRTLSADRVSYGTPVTVKLEITNQSSHLEEVMIEDLVPQRLVLTDGESRAFTSLPPGERIELEYTVSGRRGSFDFSGVRATASDQLGLFQRQATFPAPGHLTVLPEVLKLRRVGIRPLRTHGYAGPIPARRGGSGVEFFGVREYQSGDTHRCINWRISARHPRALFTNEFEQERIADVGLILDARQRSDVSSNDDSLFEYAVRATASLAEAFLFDGNRVGLLVYGGFLDWTFPGYGKVQRERILRALARAETGESLVFESLDYIPTRFFPARSQLVIISSLFSDDLPMLIRLRARGYQILLISPDPGAFEARALEPRPSVTLATRIVHLERALLLRKLRHAGIQVVDWQVDLPFDQVVHTSLGRALHWFRTVAVEA